MKKTENTVIILRASYIIEMLWIHFPLSINHIIT